jgi:hypothetical protein
VVGPPAPPDEAIVSTDVTVTKVTCTLATTGMFVGGLIYTSSSFSAAGYQTTCIDGIPKISPALYYNGSPSGDVNATLFPGDKVFIEVIETSGYTDIEYRIDNGGLFKGDSLSGSTAVAVVAGVASQPTSDPPPIPKFGQIAFSSARLNDQTPSEAGAVAFNMKLDGRLLIQTLPLKGNAWSEKFWHS